MGVVASSTAVAVRSLFAEVRCRSCRRLLFKWEYTGTATIESKCPRCGSIDTIRLSTK